MSEREEFCKAAADAARLSGGIQKKSFGKRHDVKMKGVADLVTEVDVACEKAIVGLLSGRFPNHSFLAEEGGESAPGSDYLWVIDPLDGTTNYAHGYPRFCTSIALAWKGEVVVGVVYNPMLDEMFMAMKGRGARLNGESVHVSEVGKVEDALLCTGFSYDRGERLTLDLETYLKVLPVAQSLRRDGCAALDLCDVAAGRFDGFWERNLNPWDVAAGSLMITEAGGTISGISGAPFDMRAREFAGSNGRIHKELLELFKGRSTMKLVVPEQGDRT